MSEKIYAILIRLYPAEFRRHYEEEMLQLLHDRLRDERGFLKRTRLWRDLLADAIVGLPSSYRNSYAATTAVSLPINISGIPSFGLLREEPLDHGAIFAGGALSLLALAVFMFVLNRQNYHLPPAADRNTSPIESVIRRLNRNPLPSAAPDHLPNAAPSSSAQKPDAPDTAARLSSMGAGNQDTSRKLTFEVASIRQSKPGALTTPSFILDNSDSYRPFPDPRGRLVANFPIVVYIKFAYKLSLTSEQTEVMLAHLPKWVAEDNFEIHATAEGNPTKDEMRVMLRSLLADRFKLAVHFETRQVPVFALVLDKPGKTGPKLRLHAEGPACDADASASASRKPATDVFPPICDAFMLIPSQDHEVQWGSRNTTTKLIADSLASVGRLGRPVVDQTGLTGKFDVTLQWTRDPGGPGEPGGDIPANSQGATFLQALKDQLGMKLKSTTAPMNVLVIDHVERPTEN